MKKIIFSFSIVTLIISLMVLIFQSFDYVFIAYLFASIVFFVHYQFFDKIPKLGHVGLSILYSLPVAMMIFIIVYGNRHTTDFTEDVVFVLGAGLQNNEITATIEARLNQTLQYFERNPEAMFILCGGYGDDQMISEARAMANFLITNGIPAHQIIIEDLSTSTFENFKFGLTILEDYFPDGFSAVIITNNFHIYRAGYLARYLGINPSHFGASTPMRMWHHHFVREWMALFNTWLFQT